MDSAPLQLHSERHGRPRALSDDDLVLLVWKRLVRLRKRGFFFGTLQDYQGPEQHRTPAEHPDAEAFLTERLRISGLGEDLLKRDSPPVGFMIRFSTDVLLDLIELLYAEVVQEPIMVHPPECTDVEGFDREKGRAIFRREINEVLALGSPQRELLPVGHVVEVDSEHRELYAEPLPVDTETEVADPVEHALGLFLRRGATDEDKRAAVKQLADALEHLRPEVNERILSKDERDLFRIANEFAIRHNRPGQRRNYDKPIWLNWLFHVYLATVHLVLALRERTASAGGESRPEQL